MTFTVRPRAKLAYRARSLGNLLRMGHCAPTVAQTLLDLPRAEPAWLIRLVAGLPGGIGNTGFECGGLTAPLIVLGLQPELSAVRAGLPVLFDGGYAYYRRFLDENDTPLCQELQTSGRIPVRCVRAILSSPGLFAKTLASDHAGAIPAASRAAYAALYAHFLEQDFHCAGAVFQYLPDIIPVDLRLRGAVSAFLGGTLFQGMTCSAFVAGVMALGLQVGEIEDSYLRVLRMLAGGMDISNESMNKFHRVINLGHRLSEGGVADGGSTQCRAITGCDFSSPAGVQSYIAAGKVATCRKIARQVADRVRDLLAEARAG